MSSSEAEKDAMKKVISEGKISSLVDLSGKEIQAVPSELIELQNLKYLYLEGNGIVLLPDNFFTKLSSLLWLDLRHNKLQKLPESIGGHAKLTTLLLEGNMLKVLPAGIGQIKSLTGLNLAGNPLEDPPLTVINQGVRAIKLYLLRKFRHKEGDSEEEEESGDEGSTQSESESEFQDKIKESSKSARKSAEKPPEECLASGSSQTVPTEYDPPLPQTTPPLDAGYYGSVLGDMPHSYIIKAWKTGSYFTRQRSMDRKASALAE